MLEFSPGIRLVGGSFWGWKQSSCESRATPKSCHAQKLSILIRRLTMGALWILLPTATPNSTNSWVVLHVVPLVSDSWILRKSWGVTMEKQDGVSC
eukprot:scaffold215_cov389-Pavlova_lutheri.AAC.6